MNGFVFRKTTDSIRKHHDIKLETNNEKRN